MTDTIKTNKNNSLKFKTYLSEEEKKQIAEEMLESVNSNNEEPEYFTE